MNTDLRISARMGVARALALLGAIRSCLMALLTPLLEKNPVKTLGAGWCGISVPVVLSMTRLIVLAFAAGVLHQMWHSGVHGWPEATLAIAIVLALPITGALDRMRPGEVLDLAKTLLHRFGEGDVSDAITVVPAEAREPSKYDDHRDTDCHSERSALECRPERSEGPALPGATEQEAA